MKKKRLIALFMLFYIGGVLFGQGIRQIDTININKTNLHKHLEVTSQIKNAELEKVSGGNLANVLKYLPGVTLLQNGANISKPVIQGLTNQRVLTLNNGVRVEGHQWGSDHAPEIDPFLAQNIEVIKGAESVKYGSNAIGGVIVLRSEKLPYFGKKIGGKVNLIGESNTQKWAGNILLQGGWSKENAFAWRIQSSAKKAGNYHTADYFVDNTGARELNYSAILGYKMPKEKVEFFYSYFSTKLGVYTGSRIGSQFDWELRLSEGRPLGNGRFSYEIGLPKQDVKHHLAKFLLESNRDFGKINLVYAFQKNFRQEYDRRRGRFADKPTLDAVLSTHTTTLDYEKKYLQYFKTYMGGSFSRQENYNISGNGVNSIIPNFISNNFGAYFSEEFKKDSWLLMGGIRYDYKSFKAVGYDKAGNYYSGNRVFKNWSYNFGVNKTFGKNFSIASNIGLAWRAPESIELFSNGTHHGSAFYIKGDERLNLERGLKWSSKLQYTHKRLEVSADVFLQKIKGFIYEMPTGEFFNTWGGEFPVFAYKQSDAFFRGADLDLKYKISSWLDYKGRFSLIYASNLTENYYFPYISPESLSHRLDFKLDSLIKLNNTYLGVEHYWANKQKRFSPEADLIPQSPPAYHLFNIYLGTDVSIVNQNDMNISLVANNVLNRLYKDYTDRFRYFAHAMGRNIQFRLNYNF